MNLANIGMLALQIFMSLHFSNPMSQSRRKFMLVYQAELGRLEQGFEGQRDENLDRERFERYHMAAIRDADLQIKLISAFLTQNNGVQNQEDAT